jgi:hypothetical protein
MSSYPLQKGGKHEQDRENQGCFPMSLSLIASSRDVQNIPDLVGNILNMTISCSYFSILFSCITRLTIRARLLEELST